MIGFAASDPDPATLVAAVPLSLNVHAWPSLDTFVDEIVESGAIRVFARSAFESGHDPEAPAGEAAGLAVMVLQAGFAAVTPAASREQQPAGARQGDAGRPAA